MHQRTDRSSVGPLASEDLAELTAAVAADPGCDAFSVLAELHRRAGRLGLARQIAEAGLALRPQHLEGRVALGLALMDLGELDSAREVLAGALPGGATSASPSGEQAPACPTVAAASNESNSSPAPDPLVSAFNDFEIDQAFDAADSDPSEMMDANRVAERVLDQQMSDFSNDTGARHENFEGPVGVAPYGDDRPYTDEPIDDTNRARILATLESWRQNIRRPVL